jgi:hypothetical protein
MRPYPLIGLALLASLTSGWCELTIETPRVRLAWAEDGAWQSIADQATGREYCPADAKLPLAAVYHEGKEHPAAALSRAGETLTIGFADTDTVLVYEVEAADDWTRFELSEVRGARPDRVMLVRVPVAITDNVGRRLNIAWDDEYAVCLLAANRQPDCGAVARKGYAELRAATQDAPGPRLEGAAVALIACPTAEIRPMLREASHAFGLLTNEDANGTPVKDTDLVRGSYWFMTVGADDLDRLIEYCEKTGFRQVMMGFGSWCTSAGHYPFNEHRFPGGKDQLREFIARLHEHGILVGMHTFASKVSKRDAYVTPVPDPRFWRDRETKLAADISAEATEIRVEGDLSQWPGSPVCKQKRWEGGVVKHQEVIIGDEIVQYELIGPEGVWNTFLGCKRGAWGTQAAAHRAGEIGYHFGVDGCINGYIIDQETDLLDEVADRIGGIFTDCGFDMVYFDGGEDVPRTRFNYYCSRFQEAAMRKFEKRPVIHMGTVMTHLLWHSFARSSTVDNYLNTLHGAIISGQEIEQWPTVKDHIDKSVRYMLSVKQDLMPGELGWFGIWPKGQNTDGLQLDEAEYLMCKSLGYDAPISLQTSFSQMEAHPLTPEILSIVRTYEELRMARAVPDETCRKLQEMGKDFALIQSVGREPVPRHEWVEVTELPQVGGTHDVRAFVGERGEGSVATVWHYRKEGQVLVGLPPEQVRVTGFSGEPIEADQVDGKLAIPIGSTRTTLLCELPAERLRAALEGAEVRVRPPAFLFVPAGSCTELVGEMSLGSDAGIDEPEALGDVIVCTGRPSLGQVQDWYAEYTVDIPHEANWTLWARVKYPTGGDMSFGVVRPGEDVKLDHSQTLGNCGQNDGGWHWTGRGGGLSTVPPGRPITFRLPAGPFNFRIYAREGGGTAQVNPRLDCLCLTDEPDAVPTDEQAKEALANR